MNLLKMANYIAKLFAIPTLEGQTIFMQIYFTLYVVFVVCSYIFELYDSLVSHVDQITEKRGISSALGTINTAIEALTNVIITCTMFKASSKKLLMLSINEVNSGLLKYGKKPGKYSGYYLLDIVCSAIFTIDAIQIIHGLYALSNLAPFIMFDPLYRLRITISLYYICSLIRELWQQIRHINDVLSRLILSHEHNFQEERQTLLNDISILHNQLVESIFYLNDIFGWVLLCVFMNYVLLYLISFELTINLLITAPNDVDIVPEIYFVLCALMSSAVVSKNS